MLNPSSAKDESSSIVADGGIVKLPLITKKDSKPVNWVRGAKAFFHYTAYAYINPQDSNSESSQTQKHEHINGHCSHDCHGHDNIKNKVEFIESLLNKKKETKLEKEQRKKEYYSTDNDAPGPVRTKISSSRENDPKPFELRIGYSFTVTAMEIAIKTMKVGEKARFLAMPKYCEGFIQLETVMRQEKINRELKAQGKAPIIFSGCSAHASQEVFEMNKELEPAMNVPIEFEFELLNVMMPDSFQKEIWEMDADEKYLEIPNKKEEGGRYYSSKNWEKALESYTRCLELCESLANTGVVLDLKKARNDRQHGRASDEFAPPENTKIDLETLELYEKQCRLNYAACKLKLMDYNAVIIQCTHVLEKSPNSIKALFRRAQAYTELGRDLDLAKKDYQILETLIPQDKAEYSDIANGIRKLQLKVKSHAAKEKEMYSGKLFN